jgi:hypothetical protein
MEVLDICVKKIKQSIDKINASSDVITPGNFEAMFEPALTDIQMIALQVADMQAFILLNKSEGISVEQRIEINNAGLQALRAINDVNMAVDTLLVN